MLLWTVLASLLVSTQGYGYGYGGGGGSYGGGSDIFDPRPRGQESDSEWAMVPPQHEDQPPVWDVEPHPRHATHNGQIPVESHPMEAGHGYGHSSYSHSYSKKTHNSYGFGHGQEPMTGQIPMEDMHHPHGQESMMGQVPMGNIHSPYGQEPMIGQIPMESMHNTHGQEPMMGQVPMEDIHSHHGQEPMMGQIPMESMHNSHGQEPMMGQIPMEDMRHPHGQEPMMGQVPMENTFQTHGQQPMNGQIPMEETHFSSGFDKLTHGSSHHSYGQVPTDEHIPVEKHHNFEGQQPEETDHIHFEEENEHERGQEPVEADVQSDPSYRPGYSYGKTYGAHGTQGFMPGSYKKQHGYRGYGHHLSEGCSASLKAPMNSKLVCINKSDCVATCIEDYIFPVGVSELSIICEDGMWKVKGSPDYNIPSCSPLCQPRCQNGGECIQPNSCQCPENFYGPYCQYERKPCLDKPVMPGNSKMICYNNMDCSITCQKNHEFPDGSTKTELKCKDGEWVPARKDWSFLPDCEPVCAPPCENGGKCISNNQCQCPQEFRGPQCQYSADACDIRVLGFNGNYNCSKDHETMKCIMNCPAGMSFKETPAELYVCRYETGQFLPPSVPKCVFDNKRDDLLLNYVFPDDTEQIDTSEHHYYQHGVKHTKIQRKDSLYWSCYTWHGDHYRTFDGSVKSFENDCSKKIVDGDLAFQKLKIETPATKPTCNPSKGPCSYLLVEIDTHNFKFSLDASNKLIIHDGNSTYSAPKQLDVLKIELGSNSMTIHMGKTLTVIWNFKDYLDLKIEKSALRQVSGICGIVNRDEFGEKLLPNDEGICQNETPHLCVNSFTEQKAEEFCGRILKDPKFSACHKYVDAKEFFEACKWDYCACETAGENNNCGCQSISMFIKECREQDVKIDFWRESDFCPMNCEGGKVYQSCGKDQVCGGVESEGTDCQEGCFCPEGNYAYNNTCLAHDQCPCKLRGRSFPPGKEIPKDCNTCKCTNGSWVCTKLKCSARCEAVGDPHYLTFDKMNYEFMGKCSYVMVQTDNYVIETENTPCDGAISESMGYSTYFYKDKPSCTKAVTIRIGDTEIRLEQDKHVSVNGKNHEIPATLKKAYIRRASSIFIQVTLDDGMEILWDGKTRVYVQAPPELKGKTKGLCGTFNSKRSDDFLTPEGDIEQDAVSFGNKWKTKESCATSNQNTDDPCSKVDSKIVEEAKRVCNVIHDSVFHECELEDNEKEIYYKFCMYDVCSCGQKPSDCYCPILAALADRCSKGGHQIDWRPKVRGCGLNCPRGQVYQVCGNSCARSCLDISRKNKCVSSCMEGCYCPPGYTMDHREICIPISECPCIRKGLDYPAGHKEIRPDAKGPRLCTCQNAHWECHKATPGELKTYENNTIEEKICSAAKHQIYTHCEPSTPTTCQNMHSVHRDQSEAVCYGGCICKKGYVLDSITNECVKPEDCPCHHGGKSFHDGYVIHDKCNTCKCKSGKWTCTDHICPGVCTTWGDSHFNSFDGKIFDFQGACEYVLTKGALSAAASDCFSIIVELVPCGSGVSCSKSVTLNVGSGDLKETLIFSEGKTTALSKLDRITQRETGSYLFAEVYDLGIVLQWDKGTIISVKMDPKWKDRVKGLCGNFNGVYSDDFQTPSGGEETSAELFGDSWKIYDYCPDVEQIKDTCQMHPNRKPWALEKCGILKSKLFKRCHSEVPVDPYMERCVFDTCGCDQGGDCDCMCTAVAAYAQECNINGVPIKWRSPKFCPMQCDETCSQYSPCISTCPDETCDSWIAGKPEAGNLCKHDACVEGCAFKQCPEGEIYRNSSKTDCVPKAECEPICMTINGKDYFEGDVIESDDCHRCFCTHNKKSCLGQPCTTPMPTTEVLPHDQVMTCVSGWTDWINTNVYVKGSYEDEHERLPLPNDFTESFMMSPRCTQDKMVDIKCRTVGSHLSQKETGEDAECSLERGLYCKNDCHDYEIQVLCQCEPPTTQKPRITTDIAICDMSQPRHSDYSDCTHYFECVDTEEGLKVMEKHCDIGTLFDNETLSCQPENTVYANRMECSEEIERGEIPSIIRTNPDENLNGCAADEEWDSCAFRCDQLCNYAEHVMLKARCQFGSNCLEGCKPRTPCPEGKRWRDLKTCVDINECTCASNTDQMVKPAEVIKGNCTTCQCKNNEYICQEIDCRPSTTPAPPRETTFENIIIIQTTTSPPPACEDERFVPLLPNLPNTAFTASSSAGGVSPSDSRISNIDGSWRPSQLDVEQYLDIDLGKVEPIYGIVMSGHPTVYAFVQNFYVLYSTDGSLYSFVSFQGIPELFKGPTTNVERVRRLFYQPVEARYVRINPASWTLEPAMRVDILGCGSPVEVVPPAIEIPQEEHPPGCTDDMSHAMNDRQLKASSSHVPLTASLISLHDNNNGWRPLTMDANQWLEFDLLEKRQITGVLTEGSGSNSVKREPIVEEKPSWVSAYTISYSHDGHDWSPVVNRDGTLELFKGNKDGTMPQKNMFWEPILTRFVRIHPVRWHNSIAMKAQLLGCYEPYPTLPPRVEETTVTIRDCNICPGVVSVASTCPCLRHDEWWDGEQCTTRSRCPCYVGFMAYAVGSVFDNEKCDQCICALNGIIECKPKQCPPCEEDLKSTLTPTCGCICKPCPEGERLCVTSNICIPSSSWCNGVIDCPDDELNCTIATTTQRIETQTCPPVECPEGFIANMSVASYEKPAEEAPRWSPFGSKSKWGSFVKNRGSYSGYNSGKGYKGKNKGTQSYGGYNSYNRNRYGYHKGYDKLVEEITTAKPEKVCPQYQCLAISTEGKKVKCEKPNCSPKYELVVTEGDNADCPNYSCELKKIEIPDGKCNVTGRTFTTFDGTEYKYDICDHTIARDKINKSWSIKKLKTCGGRQVPPCIQLNQGNDTIVLTKDFSAYYNDMKYTIPQLQKIGSQNDEFTIKQASDNFIIFTSSLDFSVIWDTQGNIKVTVPGASKGKIEGLCGYFDGDNVNDKLKPDGTLAKTSVEFGDSWGENVDCETYTCPLHIQKEAWEKCKALKEDPLSKCSSVMNLDKLMHQCAESMCTCIQQGNSSESCSCQSILELVTECQAKLPGVDLSRWRMNFDCPVDCPPGLVYKECYNRICEPCCAELMLEDACPETDQCFPGCYCPDGYVRSFDRCVKPAECRDCQCDGYGNARFVTFDRMDFTFNGKCTHTLAKTIESTTGLKFKALITHRPCKNNEDNMCLYMITLIYKDHTVQVINEIPERVTVKIDSISIDNRPFTNDWISVVESQGKCVTVSLTKLQIDLEFFNQGKGFNLRVPSHLYSGRTEGLCGSCNMNGADDFKMSSGHLTEDINEFGESWLVRDLPPGMEEENSCEVKKNLEVKECLPPDSASDLCLQLFNKELFGKCHAIVDPLSYLETCHQDLCEHQPACSSLEAYARDCQSEGICIDWRSHDLCPYKCPAGLQYDPCGLGCTETCDNFETYRKIPDACTATKGDTCSCPKGKVLRNDTCVEEKFCSPCDNEGHYPGDEWQPDDCTTCSCNKGTIQCQRIQCSNTGTVCMRGFKSITVAGTENDCCPKQICVPEPTAGPICDEPQHPQCGFGQVMKLTTSSSGCQEFICECMPKEECEDVSHEMKKEYALGMVPSLDTSSCCPKVVVNCDVKTCPQPPPCPEFHELVKRDTELCCPNYKCAIPEGKCLHEMHYIVGNNGGGERERYLLEKYSVLKSVGDTWHDGPCRLCECKEGNSEASCTLTSCSPVPENENYVMEEHYVNQQCCPTFKRTACKMGNHVYQVGQVWPSPDGNPCINMTCAVGEDHEISKQELVETCKKDCKEGWKYHNSPELSDQCCGECRPEGCLVGGVLHAKDATWFSEDNCTLFQCTIEDNQVHVVASQEKCPDLSDCPEERIYEDTCCKKCNETIPESYSNCQKQPLPANQTIGIIKFHDKIHGLCVNRNPIEGFVECRGSCDSYSAFDPMELEYRIKCLCCQPGDIFVIDVPLNCEDRYVKDFHLKLPKSCSCSPACENGHSPTV